MERWQEVRQAAMDVLHPDEKTLRHGLELHANSYVYNKDNQIVGKTVSSGYAIDNFGKNLEEMKCKMK